MIKKLIIFLIRKRLGLKDQEHFRFVGQKSDSYYYFDGLKIMKVTRERGKLTTRPSNVNLNWILDDECKIIKAGGLL